MLRLYAPGMVRQDVEAGRDSTRLSDDRHTVGHLAQTGRGRARATGLLEKGRYRPRIPNSGQCRSMGEEPQMKRTASAPRSAPDLHDDRQRRGDECSPSHWRFTAIGHRCCSEPGADYRRNTGPGDAEGSLERPRVRTGLGGRPRRGQRRCPPGGQRRQDTVVVAVFVVLGLLTVAGQSYFTWWRPKRKGLWAPSRSSCRTTTPSSCSFCCSCSVSCSVMASPASPVDFSFGPRRSTPENLLSEPSPVQRSDRQVRAVNLTSDIGGDRDRHRLVVRR